MKKTGKSIIAAICLLAALLLACPQSSAQPHGKGGWQDKMKAERVAYLTEAMGLTSSEAEKFWPVYNEMEVERKASFKKVMEAYKELDEAVEAGKPESEVSALLYNYLKCAEASHSVESRYLPRITKILSMEKVARLFLGEEEFRRQQITRWKGGGPK